MMQCVQHIPVIGLRLADVGKSVKIVADENVHVGSNPAFVVLRTSARTAQWQAETEDEAHVRHTP